MRLFWHPQGDYLAVQVDRFTKTRKSTYTSFELFSVKERDIPMEVRARISCLYPRFCMPARRVTRPAVAAICVHPPFFCPFGSRPSMQLMKEIVVRIAGWKRLSVLGDLPAVLWVPPGPELIGPPT